MAKMTRRRRRRKRMNCNPHCWISKHGSLYLKPSCEVIRKGKTLNCARTKRD